jgi:hypothetical protein
MGVGGPTPVCSPVAPDWIPSLGTNSTMIASNDYRHLSDDYLRTHPNALLRA